jgi:uncharacterized protein YggT (Ycf19 family)
LYRLSRLIWYIFYIIETILLFRFLFKLLSANPSAPFTQFIYSISYPFAQPFLYVFRSMQVAGATVEWTTIVAIIVYAVVAEALTELLLMARPVSRLEAHEKLEEQDVDV